MPTSLSTHRLSLAAWRDDDLDDYEPLVNERDPRTAAAPRDGRPTRTDLREGIVRLQNATAETGIGLLVVRVADRFAGYCGLVVGRASLDEPELAYELLSAYHGNGYATEAARAVVRAAAGTGRNRLWATVRDWNAASFRVLDKLDFERSAKITTDEFGQVIWCTRELGAIEFGTARPGGERRVGSATAQCSREHCARITDALGRSGEPVGITDARRASMGEPVRPQHRTVRRSGLAGGGSRGPCSRAW
jgi:RimJ/RimL family protein N-acetyltransferase